jgi:xanthine dehydrogenase YagR molybdenum-binding subunit
MRTIGMPAKRVDGRAKVTGEARFPSDIAVTNPAYAFLVTSAIACGKVKRFHLDEARAVPGVLDILTHENVDEFKTPPGPDGGNQTTSLESSKIWHDGQIVAVVVAETFETAREAAHKVRVEYAEDPAAATLDSKGVKHQPAAQTDQHEEIEVGDAPRAFADAAAKIDATYDTATQHHNPIELFTTTCEWNGDKLTIYEPSQFVHALRKNVAKQLDLNPANVRVISPFVGGAFGAKGGTRHYTALVAIAARRLNRPVKFVATREQCYTIGTYRAETRHRVRLAASHNGKFQAYLHDGYELCSRASTYMNGGTDTTTKIYACPNITTNITIVHADRNTPGWMRSPPEVPYLFAFESAIDELAAELGIDPVELRRINDTRVDPVKGLPFSSRSLMECFDRAGDAFGWKKRNPAPRSMRKGDWLIGWGCAATYYPAQVGAASARVRTTPEGARVEIAALELGQGTCTAIAVVVASKLGIDVQKVSVIIGDSDLPAAGLAAGSSHGSGVCNAVALACDQIRERGVAEAYAEFVPEGGDLNAAEKQAQGIPVIAGGGEVGDHMQYAFGAEFVEVRVHARTCETRVNRVVGAFAAGNVLSQTTARSQLLGGLVWGIETALHEKTEIDAGAGRYTNKNLADYLLAVNADVGDLEVILVPEEDTKVNPLGMKGVGELANPGIAPAIANAVYHATGKRVRHTPIVIEDLL